METKGPNFITPRREVSYNFIPAIIMTRHPDFLESDEYNTVKENEWDDLPGVVLAAFGKYLLGLTQEPKSKRTQQAYATLEWLVSSKESDVRTAIVVEVFETIDAHPQVLAAFYELLGEESKALYIASRED